MIHTDCPKVTETTTIQVTRCSYDALTDDQQEKVLELLSDINADYDWWDFDGHFYPVESKRIGNCKPETGDLCDLIKPEPLSFDLGRGEYLNVGNARFTDDDRAMAYFGVPKRMRKLVEYSFEAGRHEWPSRFQCYWEGVKEPTEYQQKIMDRMTEGVNDMLAEAMRNLKRQYEYATSTEAIEETIRANEYMFDPKTGKIV